MKKLISLLVTLSLALFCFTVFAHYSDSDTTNPPQLSSELLVDESTEAPSESNSLANTKPYTAAHNPNENANGQAEEPNIQELIMRLEQAEENNVPVYFSLDEMNTFLEQAPADIIEAMIKHIEKFAEPAPMPIVDMETAPKQNQQRSDTYLSYDFSTRIEQVLPFDNSDPNTTVQESEGSDVNDDASVPSTRAYPD